MKNEGFTTPKIWVITPKDEGFTWVPMVLTNWGVLILAQADGGTTEFDGILMGAVGV